MRRIRHKRNRADGHGLCGHGPWGQLAPAEPAGGSRVAAAHAARSVQLPAFAWVAMQQFTPAEQETIGDFAGYLEVVVRRHANGRIKSESLAYFLYGGSGLWIGEELTTAVKNTAAAWWTWAVHGRRDDLDDELTALAQAVQERLGGVA
jgi:hypothetical protein